MNLAFVSRERRDKQISVDRESYGYVTEADFWGVEIGWVNPSAFMEGNRREHVGLIRVWEI